MSQFCAHHNLNLSTKDLYPFLLDVQFPLFESLETRLVIPLSLKSRFQQTPMKNLTPVFEIDGSEFLVWTPQMAAIPRKVLGSIAFDLSSRRSEIISSIDFLMTGF